MPRHRLRLFEAVGLELEYMVVHRATGAVAPQQDIKQKKQAFFVFIGQFNGKLRLIEIRQQTQVVTGKASAIAVTNSGKTPSIAVNQLRDSTPTFIVH